MKKYVSYSELDCWERSRSDYVKRYVEGEEFKPNRLMEVGTMIHKVIEDPLYPWLEEARRLGFGGPELMTLRKTITKAMAKRPVASEVILTAKLEDFELFVKMDGYDPNTLELDEYKTTDKSHWYEWQVHKNFQLDFYALCLWQNRHDFFTRIRLHEINWAKGTAHTFKTARSYTDISRTRYRVIDIVKAIREAGLWDKRLSRADRDKMANLKLPLDGLS